MEVKDVLEWNSVDGVSVLDDVALVQLFLSLQDFLESQSGVGKIFRGFELDAVWVISMRWYELCLYELLKQTILL